MKQTVCITGATSGIGLACAHVFAKNGYRLIVCGRRADRLLSIKKQLEQENDAEVYTIQLDVRERDAVSQSFHLLPPNWQAIDILINNAGLALGLDFIDDGDIDHWDQMIDTNIKGLLYVSRAIIPGMRERKKGHIINIGSIAGRETYPKGNVYCATKHAVDAISKGMRIDLVSHGIKVSQVSPGAVNTEFSQVRFDGDQERAKAVYKGFTPLHGEDVAGVVFYVASLPPHVNIDDVLVMPVSQASATTIHRNQD